jgi:signal transduction histidine kinase
LRVKRWWRLRSLRTRLLLIGLVGLCAGFLAGGVTLVLVLGIVLQRAVDADAAATATQVAKLIEEGPLPQPLPVAEGGWVQVVDAQGRVRGASADADPLQPLLSPDDLDRVRAGQRLTLRGDDRVSVHSGPIRVVGLVAGPPEDPQTVVVAWPLTDVLRGQHLLRTHLSVLFPLLLFGAALVAWRVLGAALRPVEALRRGAEEITGAGAGGRLPVPETRDEIHALALTLNDMLDRLDAGRARQREFVADAAHELRSPLANMRTQLEVAQHLGDRADWPAVGVDLLTDTTRLSRLVDDLLLLARADAAPRPLPTEPVDLAAIARDVAQRAGAAVSVRGESPLWTVGDEGELRRVVVNLVENAVRYARTGVELDTHAEGDRAVLTVTDDGTGIPLADRGRVFERFTRLDSSRTSDTGGAGLGLAIVRELVRHHHGSVTLHDANPDTVPPQTPGLRVEVRLPAATHVPEMD